MLTEIRLITCAHPLWPDCQKIYTDLFPIDERREPDQLKAFQGFPGYFFNAILTGGQLSGIFEIWDFPYFIFIEHIAVIPAMQNKGIGSSILSGLLKESEKPVLLETEVPFDEVSQKRIDFYKSKGFKVLDIDYTQPPYYPGKKSVPMLLLSDKDLPAKAVNEAIQTLKLIVYKML